MASVFERLSPNSGGGNQLPGGHVDAVVEVLQREEDGQILYPEAERANPVSIVNAGAQGGPPTGPGFEALSLDNIDVKRYQGAQSALIWRFQYSNDGWFNLGTISNDVRLEPGLFNQTPFDVKRDFPLVLQSLRLTGRTLPPFGTPEFELTETPFTTPIIEQQTSWQVKCTSENWTVTAATQIARRAGSIHIIDGFRYEFRGARSVRRISSTEYEIVYEWVIDPGSRTVSVRSEQDTGSDRILTPGFVAAGDPALVDPYGNTFDEAAFVRLPYHELELIAPPAGTQNDWRWMQVTYKTWNPLWQNDWIGLPGDPIGGLG